MEEVTKSAGVSKIIHLDLNLCPPRKVESSREPQCFLLYKGNNRTRLFSQQKFEYLLDPTGCVYSRGQNGLRSKVRTAGGKMDCRGQRTLNVCLSFPGNAKRLLCLALHDVIVYSGF